MDYSKIDVISIENINMSDSPDFCDAYIDQADYDGVEMTDEQLEEINQDSEFVYDAVMKSIY